MPPLVYSYETAFDLFRGPTAPYAILLLIALPLLSLSVDRMRWWLLTAMFFIIPLDGMRLYVVDAALLHGSIDFGYHPLLEWLMRYSRPLFMLIILCMLLSALRFSRGWRTVLVCRTAKLLLALQLFMAFRMMLSGLTRTKGVQAMVAAPMLFFLLVPFVSSWIQSMADARKIALSIIWALVWLHLCVFVQMIHSLDPIIVNGRSYWASTNPQASSMILALTIPMLLWVIVDKKFTRQQRIVTICCLVANVFFLMWTGSRMGLLAMIVGALVFFRSRLSRGVLIIGVITALVLALEAAFGEHSSIMFHRITSAGNTRAGAWEIAIAQFMRSPLLGSEGAGYAESAYLSAFGRFGIIGGGLILAFVGSLLGELLQLRRRYKHTEHQGLSDCLIASFLALLTVAVFEASMLGSLAFWVFLLLVLLALLAFTQDHIRRAEYDLAYAQL